MESLELEEHLLLAARTDAGEPLDEDLCRKLLSLDAVTGGKAAGVPPPALRELTEARVRTTISELEERNGRFFDEEVEKLDRWSDDLKTGLERELK